MTTLLNEITFDVDINSEFGISGGIAGNAENGVNGVGRLTVSLKSNTTGSMSTSALASLIPMQTTPRYIRKPSVKISTKCNDTNALGNITTNDTDIRDLKVTLTEQLKMIFKRELFMKLNFLRQVGIGYTTVMKMQRIILKCQNHFTLKLVVLH